VLVAVALGLVVVVAAPVAQFDQEFVTSHEWKCDWPIATKGINTVPEVKVFRRFYRAIL
jgi:hypothetical protein